MSSLNNIIKITSSQGGAILASNPLIDFVIPAGGTYDLSKSYVNLNMTVTDSNNDGTVYLPTIQYVDANSNLLPEILTNVAVVRNMNMNCRQGQICNIRRVDCLRATLNEYTQTTSEQLSMDYNNLVSSYDEYQQLNTIFREIRREGTNKSQNLTSDVRIPLNQLCNFGNIKEYDTSKFGETRIHMQLNLDMLTVNQYQSSTASDGWDTSARNTCKNLTATDDLLTLYGAVAFPNLQNSPYFVNQKILVTADKVLTADADEAVLTATVTDGGTTYNANDENNFSGGTGTSAKYKITTVAAGVITAFTIEDGGSGYVVGDVLGFAGNGADDGTCTVATVNTSGQITKTVNIESINYPVKDGTGNTKAYMPELSLSEALGVLLTGTELLRNITVVGVDCTFDAVCNYGEIVLEEVTNPVNTPSELTYSEYVSEEYTTAPVANFQRQFQVEPECTNLYVMTPTNILSFANDTVRWRFRNNNKDLTNRDVEYKSPLNLDRLSMSLGSSNLQFKNSNQVYQTMGAGTVTQDEAYPETNKLIMMTNPLPLSIQMKMVQVNIQATTATIQNIILYKECIRNLKSN